MPIMMIFKLTEIYLSMDEHYMYKNILVVKIITWQHCDRYY